MKQKVEPKMKNRIILNPDLQIQSEDFLKIKLSLVESQKFWGVIWYMNFIGHESNNKLSTISAGIQLSKLRCPESDPLFSILEKSQIASKAIAGVFKDFQLFKQYLTFTTTPVNIHELIRESISLICLKFKLSEKEIQFHDSQTEIVVGSNADLIRLLIFCLIENAVEASKNNKPVTIDLKNENESIVISIQDKGNGFPDSIDREQFLPMNSTKSIPGAGWGLFIAERSCRILNGSFSIETKETGTTVNIVFPSNTR